MPLDLPANGRPQECFPIQDIQESGAILIVVKDRFLPIASRSQMIECAGILVSLRSANC